MENLETIDRGKYLEATRKDGLKIFLDKNNDILNTTLNEVKRCGSREQVFVATGLIRGLQIAKNYAEKHGTKADMQVVENLISNNIKMLKE